VPRSRAILTSLIACGISLMVLGCISSMFPERKKYRVEYRVEGTAKSCVVRYNAERDERRTLTGVVPPWSYAFSAKRGTQWAYLEARKDSSYEASLIATICLDGSVVESDTASIPYMGDGVTLTQFLYCPD
jgi:hypothetical protein